MPELTAVIAGSLGVATTPPSESRPGGTNPERQLQLWDSDGLGHVDLLNTSLDVGSISTWATMVGQPTAI